MQHSLTSVSLFQGTLYVADVSVTYKGSGKRKKNQFYDSFCHILAFERLEEAFFLFLFFRLIKKLLLEFMPETPSKMLFYRTSVVRKYNCTLTLIVVLCNY